MVSDFALSFFGAEYDSPKTNLSIMVELCMSIYPSIHPSIYPPIYLSIYPSIYLSIYLSATHATLHKMTASFPGTKIYAATGFDMQQILDRLRMLRVSSLPFEGLI